MLDPDFATNRLVYVAFVEGDVAANHTAVWRAKYDGSRLTGGRVTLIMLGVAAVASWLPARRAAQVDPMEVLRYE